MLMWIPATVGLEMLAVFSVLASLVGKRALVVWQQRGWHHEG